MCHAKTLVLAAVISLLGCGGCINYPSAKGEFVGSVSTAMVQTDDQKWHRVYLMHVERGPGFQSNDRGERGRELYPSSGKRAVLVRSRRGALYALDPSLEGKTVRVRGVMFPCVADIDGKRMIAAQDHGKLPDDCLQVSKVMEP